LPILRSPSALLATAALAIGALIALMPRIQPHVEAFRAWVETLGLWGPLVFIAGYALAIVALIPGSLLTLSAGAIFGLGPGTLYVFTGASLGACAAFLIARHLARGAVERRLAGNRRFAAIDRAIARQGRKIAFLLRLSPVFPFTLLNYALGLTRVRLRDYALACTGILPGTSAYVYLGSLAVLESDAGSHWLQRALYVLGLGATVAVIVVITRTARRALAQATRDDV
jgi:uncharacterized membrane protein YdjX (TVP38/TMEM64 family)